MSLVHSGEGPIYDTTGITMIKKNAPPKWVQSPCKRRGEPPEPKRCSADQPALGFKNVKIVVLTRFISKQCKFLLQT